MKKACCLLVILPLLFIACGEQDHTPADRLKPSFELREDSEGFSLYVDESPFFVKGARTLGTRYIDKVAEHGGNAIRVGYNTGNVDEKLELAEQYDLYVLFGLPVSAERDGFDYSDKAAVQEQYERVRDIVKTYRDHPSIMFWALGNELDHIPGNLDYNLEMWDSLNDMAQMIQETDPGRPVMTVIGTGKREKLADLMERAPDLDLLGVNAYRDIVDIPGWLREYGWNKPYAVTEWGPSGHWEVPTTQWGAVIEETSTEKAALYRERYEHVIASDPFCIGSYAFLWTSDRMERTHTWYNMFHDDGSAKEAVQVMQYVWTGEWPDKRSPRISAIEINGLTAFDHVSLAAGSRQQARVAAEDPAGEPIAISWELLPELDEFAAYAGQGEAKPDSIPDFIIARNEAGDEITFRVPDDAGQNYRLFVYVHDRHNNVAAANIPFHTGP